MLQLVLPVTMVTLSTELLSELVDVPKNGLDPTPLVNVSTVIKRKFEKKCVCEGGGRYVLKFAICPPLHKHLHFKWVARRQKGR